MKNVIFMNIFNQEGNAWTYLKSEIINFDKAESSVEYKNDILWKLIEIIELYDIIFTNEFMPNHYNVFIKEKL